MKVSSIIIGSLVALVFLTLFPFGLNLVANHVNITSQADFSGWLGFMGSYIGGILSGAITLIGVLIGFRFERTKNLVHRYLSMSVEIEELGEHLQDDIRELSVMRKIVDKNPTLNLQEGMKNWLKNKREKYNKYEKICGSVDINLLREMKQFNGYLFNLYFDFDMSLPDEKDIAESGERNFNEDFENLKNSEKRLQKMLKDLGAISKKYQ